MRTQSKPRSAGATYGSERKPKEPIPTWFKRMSRQYGVHPRYLAASPKCMEEARIGEEELSLTVKPYLPELSRECWEQAMLWRDEYNSSPIPAKPGAAAFVGLNHQLWFSIDQPVIVPLPLGVGTSTTTSSQESTPKKRMTLFGQSPTAVMRWMGANGWSAAEGVRALGRLGISCSSSTVSIQVRAGAKGDGARGEPATLSPKETAQLESHRR